MAPEEKQLLLIDLCARLPYGVKCRFYYTENKKVAFGANFLDTKISHEDLEWLTSHKTDFVDVKPYLRPMSSMTDEELSEYRSTCGYWNICGTVIYENKAGSFDWLNAHHFDYHGLIPKGLALEAPKDMYKTE